MAENKTHLLPVVWDKILPELVQIIARRREVREKASYVPFCLCPECQEAGTAAMDNLANAFADALDESDDDVDSDFDYDSDDEDAGLGGILATIMLYYGFM